MVNVWPATLSVPLRAAVVVFAPTEYASVPLPVPDAPEVTVIQLALLIDPHAHEEVTLTEPVAPPEPTLTEVGVMVDVPHVDVSANVPETALAVDPPGPFARTRAS